MSDKSHRHTYSATVNNIRLLIYACHYLVHTVTDHNRQKCHEKFYTVLLK